MLPPIPYGRFKKYSRLPKALSEHDERLDMLVTPSSEGRQAPHFGEGFDLRRAIRGIGIVPFGRLRHANSGHRVPAVAPRRHSETHPTEQLFRNEESRADLSGHAMD
jgi:hypothetical protein